MGYTGFALNMYSMLKGSMIIYINWNMVLLKKNNFNILFSVNLLSDVHLKFQNIQHDV